MKTACDVTSNVASQVGNAARMLQKKARRLPLLLPNKLRLLPPSSRPSGVTILSVQWLLP